MRIDQEYLRDMLGRVLEHKTADFNINIFSDWWNNDEDVEAQHKFVFHLEILADQRFIESATNTSGIGIRRVGNASDPYVWSIIPLRLTAFGHDFAAALDKPDVFKILKEKFNNEGPVEFMKAAIKISSNLAEKKLNSLLD